MWIVYALLAALFAALTAILAKLGLSNVPSNLATAIRTIVVLLMSWGIVFLTGQQRGIQNITLKGLWLLIASGVATGLSWLFYFKAIQLGDVSKVAPIDKLSVVITMLLAFFILGESFDIKSIVGGALIAIGAIVIVL